MTPRFELFGLAHLGALAAIGIAAAVGAALARRPRFARGIRWGLAAMLLVAVGVYVASMAARGPLNPWHLLPLHLCDMAILVALYALVTRSRAASELVYFWGASGTLLASIMPDLSRGFPSLRFITYFALHGGVIVAAFVLAFGVHRGLRKGAPWRAWALTNVYAGLVALVDVAFDKNYLYLIRKPVNATLLDWMGPWPVYILVAEGVALGAFWLLYLAAIKGSRRSR